jgi:hypothetical protein
MGSNLRASSTGERHQAATQLLLEPLCSNHSCFARPTPHLRGWVRPRCTQPCCTVKRCLDVAARYFGTGAANGRRVTRIFRITASACMQMQGHEAGAPPGDSAGRAAGPADLPQQLAGRRHVPTRAGAAVGRVRRSGSGARCAALPLGQLGAACPLTLPRTAAQPSRHHAPASSLMGSRHAAAGHWRCQPQNSLSLQ